MSWFPLVHVRVSVSEGVGVGARDDDGEVLAVVDEEDDREGVEEGSLA